MKIFLTGDRQIGKSTIVQKIADKLPAAAIGGYFTRGVGQDIQMVSVHSPAAEVFTVGQRRLCGYPEVFDTKGVALLRDTKDAELLIFDEIGWMEKDAEVFSAEILKLAKSEKNILGVLRKNCDTPLCRALKNLPGIELIEVNEQNRDALAASLGERIVQLFQ